MNLSNKHINSNRLIRETSPYLLQHAHNPVDWYPWGNEAFEKAKVEDKPIFLSIGYSTCHWCHVMAHESFESEEIAKLLNKGFVSIKVDREERPDIDEVYMNVCQAMTGSGGWPLTILMTPEKVPFLAATYLPVSMTLGRIGLSELLPYILNRWQSDRHSLVAQGEQIVDYLKNREVLPDVQTVTREKVIAGGYAHIASAYEKNYGGFSHSPKFPTPHYLLFLFNYYHAHHNQEALKMAEKTLEHMYRGGIFDHVGYGFSRYSTDHMWLIPHFEKMLYDNALLLHAYSECFAITGSLRYQEIAEKICAYLLRDMRSQEGGFYCAQDADSEGIEGKYYLWGYKELQDLLTPSETRYLEMCYGVTKGGNFEGKNILNLIKGYQGEEAEKSIMIFSKLLDQRQKRIPPFKDTKISASWNGLAIEALSRAGALFGRDAYVNSAENAATFILTNMLENDGTLHNIYKDGNRSEKSFLSDYANMLNALITLYQATCKIHYMQQAISMAHHMIQFFFHAGDGRFTMTKSGENELFAHPRDDYDGALPSGNSAAIMGLLRLYLLTGEAETGKVVEKALSVFMPKAEDNPGAHIHFLSASLIWQTPHRQVVISAGKTNKEALAAYKEISRRFLPFTTVIFYDRSKEMDEVFPLLTQYKPAADFAGYVCEDFTCKQPIYSSEELLKSLRI